LVKDMQMQNYEQSNWIFMHNWKLCSMLGVDNLATSARQ